MFLGEVKVNIPCIYTVYISITKLELASLAVQAVKNQPAMH